MDSKMRARMLQEAWFDRDLSWIEFNRRVLARGAGRTHAAARAAEVPRNLHLQPRRVLHEARRRHAHPRLRERRSPRRSRNSTRTCWPARSAAPDAAAAGRVLRRPAPAPACATASGSPTGTSCQPRSVREAYGLLRQPRVAGADAAQPQPLAPVPVHVQPVDLLGLRAARPRDVGDRVLVRVKVPTDAAAVAAAARRRRTGRALLRLAAGICCGRMPRSLFPGVEIEAATLFRVSRNADIAIEEDSDNSIRELIEEQVRQRRFQPVVRLEFGEQPSAEIRDSLVTRFELRDSDVYELPGMLDYTSLFEIASLPVPRAARPAVDPAAAARHGCRRRHLLVHPRRRRAGPSPVREFRRHRSSASSATRRTTRARPRSR